MENFTVRNNPLATFAVIVAVIASVFALSYLGMILVLGDNDYEGAAVDTVEVVEEREVILDAAASDVEAVLVNADAATEGATASDDAPEAAEETAPTESAVFDDAAPADEHDCEAFFAELDAKYYADQDRYAEVLERFDIPFERMVYGESVSIEVDYDDPIIETITSSFWNEVAETQDDTVYDHPCFNDLGCEHGEAYVDDLSEEEMEEIRALRTRENAVLVEAFTKAGVDFGWETDDYLGVDRVVWDYDDEFATEVYLSAFYEIYPEFAEAEVAETDEEYAAGIEALELQWAERTARLEAFAVALDEAGVDHEVIEGYDWIGVTFDLDDDRAIPVVAAHR